MKGLILLLLLVAFPVDANEYKPGWTEQEVTILSKSCLIALKFRATIEYRQENNLTDGKLPPDFDQQLQQLSEQYRSQCECIGDKIAQNYDMNEYKKNKKQISAEYTQQLLESGDCGELPVN